MRILRNKKGQIRVIEAFLASVLVLTCLTLIPAEVTSNGSGTNLVSRAENVLLSLDSKGELASLADNHDWTALADRLETALPLTVWFNLTVYDRNLNILNDYEISNGGAVSDKITSINYICASPNSTYSIYVLQLQLAGVM